VTTSKPSNELWFKLTWSNVNVGASSFGQLADTPTSHFVIYKKKYCFEGSNFFSDMKGVKIEFD
jgi:hypothetical protein